MPRDDPEESRQRVRQGFADQHRSPPDKPEYHLFFSFDLSNSTAYKAAAGSNWLPLVTWFYDAIQAGFRKRLAGVRLWKYVGDEILLYCPVRSKKGLLRAIPVAMEILQDTIARIRTQFPGSKAFISVRGAVWGSMVRDAQPSPIAADAVSTGSTQPDPPTPEERGTVRLSLDDQTGQSGIDFLGHEVDIGFRLSQASSRGRLVVSAELAALVESLPADPRFQDEFPLSPRFRVVALRQLKGVWNGRHYPVIWFEQGESTPFQYDEHLRDDVVADVIASNRDIKDTPESILDDLGLSDELRHLREWARDLPFEVDPDGELIAATALPALPQLEVHVAAIVMSPDGKALIARRRASKRLLPRRWEFGCGQLRVGQSVEDCLRASYLEDFRLHILIPEPTVLVATYTISDPTRLTIPGLIFLAETTEPERAQALRHEETRWVSPDNPEVDEAEVVPGFRTNLSRALKLWETARGDQSR